jgi:hypothetical protein
MVRPNLPLWPVAPKLLQLWRRQLKRGSRRRLPPVKPRFHVETAELVPDGAPRRGAGGGREGLTTLTYFPLTMEVQRYGQYRHRTVGSQNLLQVEPSRPEALRIPSESLRNRPRVNRFGQHYGVNRPTTAAPLSD